VAEGERFMPLKEDDRYTLDEDGLWVEHVGSWAIEKHKIVTDYIQASGAARRKYLNSGTSYIDVFCGPGRSQIRDTHKFIDGSPVAAFEKAKSSLAPFSTMYVSDADSDLLASAEKRLVSAGAPTEAIAGPASSAMREVVTQVNQHQRAGLHFAFLDPHNLGTLSFDLFEAMAKIERIDLIVHVSLSDLQRNADRYTSKAHDEFDRFAPGWREHVGSDKSQKSIRADILAYWSQRIEELGLPRAEHCELITGGKNQPLYWLIFMSKNDFARSLWAKISSVAKAPKFDF
jgi:three-Cys-motif partner protein